MAGLLRARGLSPWLSDCTRFSSRGNRAGCRGTSGGTRRGRITEFEFVNAWAFAFSRRWAGYLALAILFAIVCSLLAAWQFTRRSEAMQEITRIDKNYSSAPAPIDSVLGSLGAFHESQKWIPVSATGTYLVDETILVRNRPYSGQSGFDVLVPLLRSDGTVFIVDRGWVKPGNTSDSPDNIPQAPAGIVTVISRLKASEPAIAGRSAPKGQVATIELPLIAGMLSQRIFTGAYGVLAAETPAPAEAPPLPAAKPERDEGPHLSYALQWYVFAIFGFLGFGYALRQEYRLVNISDPAEQLGAKDRKTKESLRSPSDSEIEDAIIDRRW